MYLAIEVNAPLPRSHTIRAHTRGDLAVKLSRFAWDQFGCPWHADELLELVESLWNGHTCIAVDGEIAVTPFEVPVRVVRNRA